jgi:hypothetical protein
MPQKSLCHPCCILVSTFIEELPQGIAETGLSPNHPQSRGITDRAAMEISIRAPGLFHYIVMRVYLNASKWKIGIAVSLPRFSHDGRDAI